VITELKRKAFHLAGFIIPATYVALLQTAGGFMTRTRCAMLLGSLALAQTILEVARLVRDVGGSAV
jgi:hypothetical protein